MKIVIDTNVFISSFLSPKGKPRKIVDLWKKGEVTLCLSVEILSEYIEVLSRFGLENEPELKEVLDLFRQHSYCELVVCDDRLNVVEADPDDNRFIECAVVARASYIVSGDKHLKELGQYAGIRIISPAEFISAVRQI
ncbi:MAG: putative toxin-antitoxin system toxin component, PIN family [Thermodesulfovibrio sp.]|nr:putative toxin-antitoxin system toxin component, PIN family [Thermodesulfovibrio sp.]